MKIGGKERVVCKESNPLSVATQAKDRPETGAAQSAVAAVSCNRVCVCSSISGSAGSAIHGTHTSLEGIAWLFPIDRLSLAFYHPSIDGVVPCIHVDIDEVLAVIVDDSSFDDAGDGIPRSGAAS